VKRQVPTHRNSEAREPQHAYLIPAKPLAMTAIDLLYDDGARAKEIIGGFKRR
jgi:hypothetical protein